MTIETEGIVSVLCALTLSPLLLGVIQRTKAGFAGRKGPPLTQVYRDLRKLFGKGAVYSRTTTWVFRAGPIVSLCATLTALALLPLGGRLALLWFPADFLVVAGLLALARFATMLAALDTGSSFEGMGASREAQLSALAEPTLLLSLAVIARATGTLSLSTMAPALADGGWARTGPALALAATALLVVYLAENARIPVDDPATHLELTMIHEAMVLDHGGPDFGLIVYDSALKLWALGSVLVGLVVPVRTGNPWIDLGAAITGLFALAVATGAIESSMARLRLIRIPQLLVGAAALASFSLALVLR